MKTMTNFTIDQNTANMIGYLETHNAANKLLGKRKTVTVIVKRGDLLILDNHWKELQDKAFDFWENNNDD